jgi:hypothetical protein
MDLNTLDKAIHDTWIQLTAARATHSFFATHREETLNRLLDKRLEMHMTAPTQWPTEIDGEETEDDNQ